MESLSRCCFNPLLPICVSEPFLDHYILYRCGLLLPPFRGKPPWRLCAWAFGYLHEQSPDPAQDNHSSLPFRKPNRRLESSFSIIIMRTIHRLWTCCACRSQWSEATTPSCLTCGHQHGSCDEIKSNSIDSDSEVDAKKNSTVQNPGILRPSPEYYPQSVLQVEPEYYTLDIKQPQPRLPPVNHSLTKKERLVWTCV